VNTTMAVGGKPHTQSGPIPQILGAAAVVVLVAAIRTGTPAQIPAALVAAVMTAILDRFPIYLNPIGEVPISGVIMGPTLVLFGWPAAVMGSAMAMIPALFSRPWTHGLVRGSERLTGLAAAALAVSAVRISGSYRDVDAVLLAAIAIGVTHTGAAAIRLHFEEGIAWLRGLSYLMEATFFHHMVVMAVAAAAVWTIMNSTSTVDRLLVPVVAAAVTLQLYLPRILRGHEQRRVLAAVSVLAAAVDAKDPYTADHSHSVAQLCLRVARGMGMKEQQAHRVYLAALLHDVGKTVVPPEILRKAGPLTREERDVVRTHVDAGVRIIKTIRGLTDIAPIVAASHERIDGSGYPKGLAGEEIPLAARITLAVDAYNAMTTDRTYRPAGPPTTAVQELEAHAGTQFDPVVVAALRDAVGLARAPSSRTAPAWVALLRRRAFTLLWAGQMVSCVGDTIFFVALTFWVLKLTGSATMVALTLIAATVGQGLMGLLAGALADRIDRRRVIIATDLCRAAVVAALPLLLPRSLPAGFLMLIFLNVGTVFFRTAVFALIPSLVPREDLATANALFQSTQRIAEILGGVLGGAIVVALGFQMVFYLDAATFIVSAVCVSMMPLVWRAGLNTSSSGKISTEINEGLRYIWHSPLHRVLGLLAVTGYLTLAFDALQSPMVIRTANLDAVAYGVINSALAVGKLVAATALTALGKRLATVSFAVMMFLLTALATALFGTTVFYPALIAAAFLIGLGNVSTNIANATLSLGNVPSELAGRLMASRQVFIAATTLVGMLVFGRLADVAGPPVALIALGCTSGVSVMAVWILAGRRLREAVPVAAPQQRVARTKLAS
jgi:putative nucleotidyltransferase with HDIG domain